MGGLFGWWRYLFGGKRFGAPLVKVVFPSWARTVLMGRQAKVLKAAAQARLAQPNREERAVVDRRVSERVGGSNSVVESQPSKLLVAGSIPVSRSIASARRRAGYGEMSWRSRSASGEGGLIELVSGRCSSVGRARPW
jgi:hypothetical protein